MPSVEITHFHASNCTNETLYFVNGTWVEHDDCVVCTLEGSGGFVVLGIMIGLLSSVAINFGQNVQALGAKEPGAADKPCTSKKWVTGLSIFITGSLGNMVAMAFASATILVPLESSQFVTNVLFSKFVNKGTITDRQWFGTFLAVLGTVFTCVFGPNDERCFTIDELIGFWSSPAWLTYLFLTIGMSFCGWTAYARLQQLDAQRRKEETTRPSAIAEAGLPALYAVSSALIGGAQMIVHSKALAELFDMVAGEQLTFWELLSHWFFWVELLITAVCGTYWAIQMNNAITLYDQLFIIPLLQASYITFGSTGSGIFYQEFETLAQNQMVGAGAWFFYLCGVLLVVIGILLLAPPATMGACFACLKPLGLPPVLKNISVEAQRPRSPDKGQESPGASAVSTRKASGLELVQGRSFKLNESSPSKVLWNKLRTNLDTAQSAVSGAAGAKGSSAASSKGATASSKSSAAASRRQTAAPTQPDGYGTLEDSFSSRHSASDGSSRDGSLHGGSGKLDGRTSENGVTISPVNSAKTLMDDPADAAPANQAVSSRGPSPLIVDSIVVAESDRSLKHAHV